MKKIIFAVFATFFIVNTAISQTCPTQANFTGIDISNAVVTTSGSTFFFDLVNWNGGSNIYLLENEVNASGTVVLPNGNVVNPTAPSGAPGLSNGTYGVTLSFPAGLAQGTVLYELSVFFFVGCVVDVTFVYGEPCPAVFSTTMTVDEDIIADKIIINHLIQGSTAIVLDSKDCIEFLSGAEVPLGQEVTATVGGGCN